MTITTTALTETEFYNRLEVFLGQVEKKDPNPYLDTVHHPTIGIGFDLTQNLVRNIVFNEMGIISSATKNALLTIINNPPSTAEQLQIKLNAAYGQPFVMTDTQIDSVFKTLATSHVNDVQTKTGLLFSDELVAVASAHFNGLFGTGLKTALNLVDSYEARAEAWYQIRYIHDLAQNVSRRYSEASVFGLYNDQTGTVSKDEALGIYKMYTHHYNESYLGNSGMIQYDSDNNGSKGAITLSNGDLTAMASQNTAFAGYVIQDIGHELARAAIALETAFLKPNGLTLSGINSLNIQTSYAVHPDLTGEDTTARTGYINDLLIGNSNANILDGKSGNDILIGAGGNDSLTGNEGNDTLIGGNGNDTLIGGNGDDTYIINTNGDVITENKNEGNDTVQITSDSINNSTSLNYKNVEILKVLNSHTLPLKVELNQLTQMTLSKNADDFTLHLNQYRPLSTDIIKIDTGVGADTVKLTPVSTNSIGFPDYLNFTDLSSDDKIDLTAYQIKSVVSTSINIPAIGDDYYVVKPSVSIIAGGTIAFFNSTTDWKIVEILNMGVNPYQVSLSGNITTSNFVI